jgi:spore coat polysaccharide biosynthesis protein SpsF
MYLKDRGVKVQQSSLDDVLMRFVDVTKKFEFQTVVRLIADCPITNPEVIDEAVELFLNFGVDYVSNSLDRTFARGLDVEVVRPEVLREVAQMDFRPMSREHVTYGVYTRTDIYSTNNFHQNPSFASLRWTVDTQDDLNFVRCVFENLYAKNANVRQREILNWLDDFPDFAHYEKGESF